LLSSTHHSPTQPFDKRIISWKPRRRSHWEYHTHWLGLWYVKLTNTFFF
jgi:hypothetical protein